MKDSPARYVWIIRNPSARKALTERRLREAAEPLRRHSGQIEVRSTREPGEAQSLARAAAAAGASAVVAAGGDGTIHEVVNGIAGTTTALGAIACGTANVWASEANLPTSPERALALVANGWRAHLDLGEVEVCGRSQYLLMCGAGLDGTVVRAMHGRRIAKRLVGRAAFMPTIIETVLRARPVAVRITAGHRELHRDLLQVVASNTTGYGGLLRLNSGARADDSMLDLVLLATASRPRMAKLLTQALRGKLHPPHTTGLDYLHESKLVIALDPTADASLEVQADGEYLGAVIPGDKLRLSTVPGALRALLPHRPSALLTTIPPPADMRSAED